MIFARELDGDYVSCDINTKPPFLGEVLLVSARLIISNQRRRGLTPKLMSYMSATAGCD